MIIIFFFPADNKFMLSSTSVWIFLEFSQSSFDKIILLRKEIELSALDLQGESLGAGFCLLHKLKQRTSPKTLCKAKHSLHHVESPGLQTVISLGQHPLLGRRWGGSGSRGHSSLTAQVGLDTIMLPPGNQRWPRDLPRHTQVLKEQPGHPSSLHC